ADGFGAAAQSGDLVKPAGEVFTRVAGQVPQDRPDQLSQRSGSAHAAILLIWVMMMRGAPPRRAKSRGDAARPGGGSGGSNFGDSVTGGCGSASQPIRWRPVPLPDGTGR